MKILWISQLVPYPPKSGVLLRAYNLVKELSKYHEVHLLAFNQRGLIEPYFENYETGSEICMQEMQKHCKRTRFFDCPTDKSPNAQVQYALLSLISKAPYNMAWLWDKNFDRCVKEWHAQESYDLIHCDTISLAPYINGIVGPKFSLDHHNVESHMLIRRSRLESNILKKIFFYQEGLRLKQYEKRYCPKFDTNITCSSLDIERLEHFIQNANFKEIPNGVDTGFFKPASNEPEQANFIFIGTLDWYPNTRAVRYIAKELWPKIKTRFPQAVMNIIGSKPPQDLVELSQRETNFNVHGFVDSLTSHLAQATIYLCPIDDGGGTKLKLLDAFSSGKAVVAHEVACEGLKTSNGKNVLIANTPDEYINCIQSLLENPEKRATLEKNARTHAENNFSFTAIGKTLSDHFISITETS